VGADLAIVIVTYNSAHVIDALLDSIPAALGGLSAQVVVVDNSSDDGTADLVERRGDSVVVRSPNVGYAAGLNLGVASADDVPAYLALNPDTRLRPLSIPPLLTALQQPATGIVAPQVLEPSGALDLSLRREPSLCRALGLNRTGHPLLAENLVHPHEYAAPRVVDWALGAALLVSRETHDALGGWDPTFFLYSEETDFCLRARDRGILTRYEPKALVEHIGGGSGQSPQTHAMQMVNRVRLYRRRHGAAAATAFWCLTIAAEAFRGLRSNRARSQAAILALLVPSRRPHELGCSHQLIPL
jgi:GT2 family glycosyltransferase